MAVTLSSVPHLCGELLRLEPCLIESPLSVVIPTLHVISSAIDFYDMLDGAAAH